MTLLVRNFGLFSSKLWRYIAFSVVNTAFEFVRRCGGAVVRLAAIIAGATDRPVRRHEIPGHHRQAPRNDPDAQAIRAALGGKPIDERQHDWDESAASAGKAVL